MMLIVQSRRQAEPIWIKLLFVWKDTQRVYLICVPIIGVTYTTFASNGGSCKKFAYNLSYLK